MPSDPPLPNSSPNVEASPPQASSSFGSLAKLIRGRTTDLLAIGVVLIAGLTLGRQIIHWWHADDPAPLAGVTAPTNWGAGGAPVDLQFGDLSLGMTRQAIAGNADAARQRLISLCSEKARSARWPERPANPSEQRLLDRLAGLTPATGKPGVWEVHLLEQPLPLALGVQFATSARESSPVGESGARKVELPLRRVVCWGWLMPLGSGSWNAYCLQPGGVARGASPDGLPDCPLPPQARRLLSLGGGAQGRMTGFAGPGPAQEWMRFYDEWARHQGGGAKGAEGAIGWQPLAGGWSGRWRSPSADKEFPYEVSWHLTPEPQSADRESWLGVLDLIPVSEPRGTP